MAAFVSHIRRRRVLMTWDEYCQMVWMLRHRGIAALAVVPPPRKQS